MSAPNPFRAMAGLTKPLKVLLGLGVVMSVVALWSSFMQAELLNRGIFDAAEAESNDAREQIVGIVQLVLYALTVVVFGCWIVRANRNVRASGAKGLRFTPGWAVGYFFVPILNLWKPYQAMMDLWRASHDPASWPTAPTSAILPTWWALWVLSNTLGHASFRAMLAAEGLKGLQVATYLQIVSEAVNIPLCLVAIVLATRIANAQGIHVRTSA